MRREEAVRGKRVEWQSLPGGGESRGQGDCRVWLLSGDRCVSEMEQVFRAVNQGSLVVR